MDGDVTRPRLPGHLRVVPGGDRVPEVAPRPLGADEDAMASPQARAAVAARAREDAAAQVPVAAFGCPCACDCGQETVWSAAWAVRNPSVAAMQRCRACLDAGHLAPLPGAASAPRAGGAGGAGDGQVGVVATVGERRTFTSQAPRADWEVQADAQAAVEHGRERTRVARERFAATVPQKFRAARVDEGVAAENARAVEQRLQLLRAGRPGGALIFGEPGMGKTWLAYALVHAALDEGLVSPWEVVHGSELTLLGPVFEAASSFADKRAAKTALLAPRARLWLINDVGRAGNLAPADRRALWDELTDVVWSNGWTLVITTNLKSGTPESATDERYLAGWLGQAAYSRVSTGSGRGNVAVPSGRDMRRAGHAQDMAEVFADG